MQTGIKQTTCSVTSITTRVCSRWQARDSDDLIICSLARNLIAQNTGGIFKNSSVFLVVKSMDMEVSSENLIKVDSQGIGFVNGILVNGELLRLQSLIPDPELNLSGNSFSTLFLSYNGIIKHVYIDNNIIFNTYFNVS